MQYFPRTLRDVQTVFWDWASSEGRDLFRIPRGILPESWEGFFHNPERNSVRIVKSIWYNRILRGIPSQSWEVFSLNLEAFQEHTYSMSIRMRISIESTEGRLPHTLSCIQYSMKGIHPECWEISLRIQRRTPKGFLSNIGKNSARILRGILPQFWKELLYNLAKKNYTEPRDEIL